MFVYALDCVFGSCFRVQANLHKADYILKCNAASKLDPSLGRLKFTPA